MTGKKATTKTGRTGTIVSVDGETVAVRFENLPPVPNPGETEYFKKSELEIEGEELPGEQVTGEQLPE